MHQQEEEQNQAAFKEAEPVVWPGGLILMLLITAILFSSLLGLGLIHLMSTAKGIELAALYDLLAGGEAADRNFIRWTILINHLTMFVLPAIGVAIFLYRRRWASFLSLHQIPDIKRLALGVLLVFVAMPLAQFSFWLNKQLPLPSWANAMEEKTGTLVSNLLQVDSGYELFFNIVVIALIPALGEEFIFRGIIQQQLSKRLQQPIMAIWLSAILFSAFHFQFEGFIPRMVLGALLGYLLYWTGNLWVPIIAHFFNNASQIIAQYFYKEQFDAMDQSLLQEVQWIPAILSLLLILGISRLFIQLKGPPASSL